MAWAQYYFGGKHIQPSISTLKGHLKQERKNLQSTKIDDEDYFPINDTPNEKTNEIICSIITFKTNKAYGDLTGKFPYTSSRGNQYFLVVYHYDANAILVTTLKNRQAATITKGYMHLYKRLQQSANAPATYILDNETSNTLLDAFVKKQNTISKSPTTPEKKECC